MTGNCNNAYSVSYIKTSAKKNVVAEPDQIV